MKGSRQELEILRKVHKSHREAELMKELRQREVLLDELKKLLRIVVDKWEHM